MTIVLTGGVGISTPDVTSGSYNQGQLAGFRNKIINGNFLLNQGSVSGTVTRVAGQYGHDMWKAGAGGCTYTFATTQNVTTITITAGSLIQVIEGLNLQSGAHTLSWEGTAQGKIGAGAFAASGVTGAAVGGTNLNIEFGVGTLSKVQLEPGTIATPFEQRFYGSELALCQRYYLPVRGTGVIGVAIGTNTALFSTPFPEQMRTTPTVIRGLPAYNADGFAVTSGSVWLDNPNPTLTATVSTVSGITLRIEGFTTALTVGSPLIFNTSTPICYLSARI